MLGLNVFNKVTSTTLHINFCGIVKQVVAIKYSDILEKGQVKSGMLSYSRHSV